MSSSGAFTARHELQLFEDPGERDAGAQRAFARALDGDAVGHGIGERHADLDHVGLRRHVRQVLAEFGAIGIARGQESHQRRLALLGGAARSAATMRSIGGAWAPVAFICDFSVRVRGPQAAGASSVCERSACPCRRARTSRSGSSPRRMLRPPSAAPPPAHARFRSPAGCPRTRQHSRTASSASSSLADT